MISGAPAGAASPVADLDSQLEAAFEDAAPDPVPAHSADAAQTELMDFETGAPPAMRPVPAQAAAAPTEIQLEPQDALGAPPKDEGDDVDELFMELLDD